MYCCVSCFCGLGVWTVRDNLPVVPVLGHNWGRWRVPLLSPWPPGGLRGLPRHLMVLVAYGAQTERPKNFWVK